MHEIQLVPILPELMAEEKKIVLEKSDQKSNSIPTNRKQMIFKLLRIVQ